MPVISKLSASAIREGGEDLILQFLLPAAEAVSVWGVNAAHVTGWYEASTVQESAVALMAGLTQLKDNRGVLVKNLKTRDEATFDATFYGSDTALIKLLKLLQSTPHRCRFGYHNEDGTTMQLHGMRNVYATSDITWAGKDGEARTLKVTLTASRTPDGKTAHEVEDVAIASETAWPASVADFKSDATP